jgi:hypothetical protein
MAFLHGPSPALGTPARWNDRHEPTDTWVTSLAMLLSQPPSMAKVA